MLSSTLLFFFFNDTATTEIYTLSLHDALPICGSVSLVAINSAGGSAIRHLTVNASNPNNTANNAKLDRKSTRLNSSHLVISYAVFCLKKKKKTCITQASTFIPISAATHSRHTP